MLDLTLPNGKTVGAYPLTPAQMFMAYLSTKYGNNLPVLNICIGYYWRGEFDSRLMKEALYEAMGRCDVIRLRFTKHPLYKILQYLADETETEIIEEDLSHMPWDEAHEFIKNRSHTVIDMFDKPLNEIRIISLENDYHGIYAKLHHLAFDGFSAKTFLIDAVSIYLNKKYGEPYPKPMRSYFECLEKDFEYADSKRRNLDAEYWTGTVLNYPEPIYTDYVRPSRLLAQRVEKNNPNLRRADVNDDDSRSKTLLYSLDLETSEKIFKACAENKFSLNCVLMAAMRTAISSFNNDEKDVSYKMMVNRRATTLEKRSGGMRVHFFSMRNIVEPEDSFARAVGKIEKTQNDIFEHSDMGSLEVLSLRHQAMKCPAFETYESVSFSYQPFLPIPCRDELMKKSSRGFWYNNDASMQLLYLTVTHRNCDGGLNFNFEYRVNNNPLSELRVFYRKMLDALLLGTGNPDIRISEILQKIKEDKAD